MYYRCLNFDSLALGFYPDAEFFKSNFATDTMTDGQTKTLIERPLPEFKNERLVYLIYKDEYFKSCTSAKTQYCY